MCQTPSRGSDCSVRLQIVMEGCEVLMCLSSVEVLQIKKKLAKTGLNHALSVR